MGSRLSLCCLLLTAMLCADSVEAALYKYVDARGVCHYTNVPGDQRYTSISLHSVPRPPGKTVLDSPSSRSLQWMKYQSNSKASAAFDSHIQRAARVHQIDPMLIKAIIKTESNFNPYAVSSQGAQGLMQLMPGTARDLHVKDPFDAWQNVYGGTRYFRKLLNTYNGNIRLSLAAYNAGPGRVKTTIPRIPETIAYVNKVMRLYRMYRNVAVAQPTTIKVRQLIVN